MIEVSLRVVELSKRELAEKRGLKNVTTDTDLDPNKIASGIEGAALYYKSFWLSTN
jgi:hypothetical protein